MSIGSTTTRFPALHQFLSCYFNQDWDLKFASPQEVLENFFEDSSKGEMHAVLKDLERFLSLNLGSESLRKALMDLGFFYTPETDGITSIQWLSNLLSIIKRHL